MGWMTLLDMLDKVLVDTFKPKMQVLVSHQCSGVFEGEFEGEQGGR